MINNFENNKFCRNLCFISCYNTNLICIRYFSLKKNMDFKDFFDVTDYLTVENSEFNYKKSILNIDNLTKKEEENTFLSFEKIEANSMLGIYKFLKYKSFNLNRLIFSLNKEKEKNMELITDLKTHLSWYDKNILFFKRKISDIDAYSTFLTPKYAFFFKKFEQIAYSDSSIKIGRLYESSSIQTLPRELRYYLFKDNYVDYDMVNSHPSILYQFAVDNKLKLSGSLESLIFKRESIMETIKQEYFQIYKQEKNYNSIKKIILTQMNRATSGDTLMTPTLKKITQDFTKIRNLIWTLYKSGALNAEYQNALRKSMRKKKKLNKNFDQKISLQSFFCQTMETKYLLNLIAFLKEKYLTILKEENIHQLNYYYPVTDKTIDLPAIYSLSIIPFFDGIYITSPNVKFNKKLNNYVEDFNKNTSDCIRFSENKIEEKKDHIKNTEELNNFLIIHNWMAKTSNKKNFFKFINHLKLMDGFFEELLSVEEACSTEEQWEQEYEQLIERSHRKVYNELLKHKLKDENEINTFIQNIECEDS